MLLRAVKVQFQIIAHYEIDSQYRKKITSTFKHLFQSKPSFWVVMPPDGINGSCFPTAYRKCTTRRGV